MKRLALVFCNPVRYGGHVTYTAHLMAGLKKMGVDVELFVPHNRTENKQRTFGYEMMYRNITITDLLSLKRKVLIVAPSKPMAHHVDELLLGKARVVIHDPAEFKHGWDTFRGIKNGAIVIRKSMLVHIPSASFIPHPYDRYWTDETTPVSHKTSGISISRIDFDKHTEILLDANRKLAGRDKIDIRGFENRIYTRFNILPSYPEWKQSIAAYPRELRIATKMCGHAAFMFDMSIIKKDGGGTQYTFLEAMDAGTVCVLNNEWILPKHVMQPGVNCLAVSTGEEAAALVKLWRKNDSRLIRQMAVIRNNCWKMLRKHDATKIAKQYIQELKL